MNKSKFKILLLMLIFSLIFNFCFLAKLKSIHDDARDGVSDALQNFIRYDMSKIKHENFNEEIYAKCVSNISKAVVLCEEYMYSNSYSKNEQFENLQLLVFELHDYILNNKEKLADIFTDFENSKLIYNIALDLDDEDSIIKALKLLKE